MSFLRLELDACITLAIPDLTSFSLLVIISFMLSIKLKIVGRRNQRSFRVVVQEARSKLKGKFVEDIGWYNPHSNKFEIKKDRVLYWLGVGAKPTETVNHLLRKASIRPAVREKSSDSSTE